MTDLPPVPPAVAAAPYEADIRADTLALLMRQSFPALFLSFLIACIMGWTLWGAVDALALAVWLAVLGASALLRLAMFMGYFRARPQGAQILVWERPYAVTLMLSALIWGLGALYLIPAGAAVEQGIVLFFLVGMVGGSVVTYSAHRAMTIGSMAAVMVPSTLWLFAQPGRVALGMAVASTVFMAGAFRATKVLSGAMQGRLLMSYQLKHAHDVAETMARTDALTGISNRRAFVERGEQTLRLCERQGQPVAALLVDVDHFKRINDHYGHAAGDLVLKQVGSLFALHFRESDVCGRLGGEEFGVLLANTDAGTAVALADKFREEIARATVHWQGERLGVTASIGIAAQGYQLETLLHHADMAMYRAKAGGRNRTVCAGQEVTCT